MSSSLTAGHDYIRLYIFVTSTLNMLNTSFQTKQIIFLYFFFFK